MPLQRTPRLRPRRYRLYCLVLIPLLLHWWLFSAVLDEPTWDIPHVKHRYIPSEFSVNTTFQNPTLVIQMRGEMGNHLSAIAHGVGVQVYAKEAWDMDFRTLIRHQVEEALEQDNPKWQPTSQTLQSCFPAFKQWNFARGKNWKEFYERKHQLEQLVAGQDQDLLDYVNGPLEGSSAKDPLPVRPPALNDALYTFARVWREEFNGTRRSMATHEYTPEISFPFLYSTSLEVTYFVDRYLPLYRMLFDLDPTCCGQLPEPDETVLHFRNFATELPIFSQGLEDVTPHQTAKELLGHLQPGDKVVITTRKHNDRLEELVSVLRQEQQLSVRVVQGQTGIQDFCFLLQTQKELIGNFQSTFAFWAAVLGQARRAVLYTLDSPRLRHRFRRQSIEDRFLFPWTHADLKDRLVLKLIPTQEEYNGKMS